MTEKEILVDNFNFNEEENTMGFLIHLGKDQKIAVKNVNFNNIKDGKIEADITSTITDTSIIPEDVVEQAINNILNNALKSASEGNIENDNRKDDSNKHS